MILSSALLYLSACVAVIPSLAWWSNNNINNNNNNQLGRKVQSAYDDGPFESRSSLPELLGQAATSSRADRRSSAWTENDEMECSKFSCSRKPCCEGNCFQIFNMPMCILLPQSSAPNFLRRRR